MFELLLSIRSDSLPYPSRGPSLLESPVPGLRSETGFSRIIAHTPGDQTVTSEGGAGRPTSERRSGAVAGRVFHTATKPLLKVNSHEHCTALDLDNAKHGRGGEVFNKLSHMQVKCDQDIHTLIVKFRPQTQPPCADFVFISQAKRLCHAWSGPPKEKGGRLTSPAYKPSTRAY